MTTKALVKQTLPGDDARTSRWKVPDTVDGLQAELAFRSEPVKARAFTLWLLAQHEIHMPSLMHIPPLEPSDRPQASLPYVVVRTMPPSSITVGPEVANPSADEFIAWLDSEDFGDDPERLRREAWGDRKQ
jgi:hypothetical protein